MGLGVGPENRLKLARSGPGEGASGGVEEKGWEWARVKGEGAWGGGTGKGLGLGQGKDIGVAILERKGFVKGYKRGLGMVQRNELRMWTGMELGWILERGWEWAKGKGLE
ncbi:hypothetical protein PoB_005748600 [Plakobranchus ocellatus]|uniref:Uncharacterized protein n=1 Tax=Plakobranchus ocellatus TaxID=259542 RepID=A0AAV4CE07_9GAST|nr:hypothetical protein PoB_005748600 [Plakobranchus ocellatus]